MGNLVMKDGNCGRLICGAVRFFGVGRAQDAKCEFPKVPLLESLNPKPRFVISMSPQGPEAP